MNDLDRKLAGMADIGTVESIEGNRAIVDLGGGVKTPPIRWAVPFAGEVNSERKPSIGEQVVLLNTCSGDCLSTMVIIAYLHSPTYPAPDSPAGTLTVDAGGYTSTINTEGLETVTATERSITANSLTETSDTHLITSGSLIVDAPFIAKLTATIKGAFTGAGGMFKSALSVAGIDFKSHTHPENNKDGGNTGGAN